MDTSSIINIPKQPKFCVCIPTYERGSAVLACVAELIDTPEGRAVPILISDNASRDGSWEQIQDLLKHPNVVLKRNEKNLGYQGNLISLFAASPAEYSIILSDEDRINISLLRNINEYLDQHENVALLSPQMEISGSVYRGKVTQTPVRMDEFLACSFYISGLIFRTAQVSAILDELGEERFTAPAQVYPQALLAATLLGRGQGVAWHTSRFAKKAESLPTRINDNSGVPSYHTLEGRAAQVTLFANFFSEMKSNATSNAEAERWHQLRRGWMRHSLKHLYSGLCQQFPEDVSEFFSSLPQWNATILRSACSPLKKRIARVINDRLPRRGHR